MTPDLRQPTAADVREIGEAYGMELSDEEIESFVELVPFLMESYERLDALSASDKRQSGDAARTVADRDPDVDEDPHNVWITRCRVSGVDDGPLAGYEVGLKDNVALAGVPMTCGWEGFERYVPRTDSTVARRLLGAGATITGKLNMDNMAFASSGETSDAGPIGNPNAPGHLAGGSSGGSAAAVAAGEVDVAIGTDQAGSIRIPASFCGTVGLKPTHGLVPYTGIVGQGYTFDHVGPIAETVRDCARALSAIAGPDVANGELVDPRQARLLGTDAAEPPAYQRQLSRGDEDLTVGVIEEGFGLRTSEPAVDETVVSALEAFDDEPGVRVVDRSIPMHRDGVHVWACVIAESNAALVQHNGVGYFVDGEYDERFAEAFGTAIDADAASLSKSMQLTLVVGRYMAVRHHGRFHARGQNLRRRLRRTYDEALSDVDVLAAPTTPITAFERRESLSTEELIQRAYSAVENTSPFNMSGHPAISVPCGTADGVPVGLMFVGKRFDEVTLLRAAKRFEERVSGRD